MKFPNKSSIKKVIKKLEVHSGTLGLSEKPTALEKFRWDICQKFIKFKRINEHSQKELASILEIDEPKVSKILHHRIDEFSTDRLISLYSKLEPNLIIKVS